MSEFNTIPVCGIKFWEDKNVIVIDKTNSYNIQNIKANFDKIVEMIKEILRKKKEATTAGLSVAVSSHYPINELRVINKINR